MSANPTMNFLGLSMRFPADVPTPDPGIANVFTDATDGNVKQKNADGSVTAFGGGGGSISVTANTGLTGNGSSGTPLAGVPSSALVPGTMSVADFSKLAAIPLVQRVPAVLGANATVITVPGLDSDTYGDYSFYGELKFATASVNNQVTLQPNADTGNAASEGGYFDDNVASAANGTGLLCAFVNTTSGGQIAQIRGFIRCKKNAGGRYFECRSYHLTGSNRHEFVSNGRYTVENTNITSLVFASNQATSLLTGSYVEVTSIPPVT
jgi:hypothetical protein